MPRDMYETTLPFGEPQLLRASDFMRHVDAQPGEGPVRIGSDARLSTLPDTLRADLMRYVEADGSLEAVEVFAACVRHGKRVTVQLQCGDRVVPLTVFAHEHLVHCPVDMTMLVERHLATMRVLQVGPAVLYPPGDPAAAPIAPHDEYHPLPALLWDVALRGARADLLPEIAGPAMYRVAPSLDVAALPVEGELLDGIHRLQSERHTLREIAEFPGYDAERAARVLNALYLQAGLIVSRVHPGARR